MCALPSPQLPLLVSVQEPALLEPELSENSFYFFEKLGHPGLWPLLVILGKDEIEAQPDRSPRQSHCRTPPPDRSPCQSQTRTPPPDRSPRQSPENTS